MPEVVRLKKPPGWVSEVATRIQVLIVGSEPDQAALIVRLLGEGGHEVAWERVETAPAMQAALERQEWDIVLADYLAPELGGLAALDVLKRTKPDIPLVIVSASTEVDLAVAAVRAGARDYILKDRLQRLVPAVERELAGAAERRERRRVEEALQSAQEKVAQGLLLQQVLQQMPAGVMIFEAPAGRLVSVNPRAVEIVGIADMPREARELAALFQAQHPDGRAYEYEERPLLRSINAGEVVLGEEVGFRRGDGERRTISVGSAPVRNAEGRIVMGVLTLVDVTEQKQAERSLQRLLAMEQARASEARLLETIQENTNAHLAYLDREFNFVRVNSAYARGSGHTPDELIGRNHFDLFPNPENEGIFRRVRDTGEPAAFYEKPFEFAHQPERGVTYWDWTLTPVKSDEGAVEGLVLSLTDVTPDVRTREKLLDAERQRTQLAETMGAEINHRMKNNLMLVAGLLEMQVSTLKADSPAAAEIREAVARISSISAVHEQLYRDQPGNVDLSDVLRRIGDVAAHALGRGNIDFTVRGGPVFLPSKSATAMAVVANELITNAVKYGAAEPSDSLRIEAELSREGGKLRLRIWNSGNPLPADFDLAKRSRMGLQMAGQVATKQLKGSLELRPHNAGTLGELLVDEKAIY